jgi:fatty-acyl-CoA synthase
MTVKATGTMAVGNLAKVAAVRFGNREAIYCTSTSRRFTFAQLNERVNRLANGLLGLGVRKGDATAFLCQNRAEIVETYFALAKIGSVGIPLNYRLAPAEMVELMSHCEAKAFLFDQPFYEVAQKVKNELPDIRRYVGVGEPPVFAVPYENLLRDSSPEEPGIDVYEEDNQYLNLTSGTTGLPKSYFLTYYNNAGAVGGIANMVELASNDVILTVFPMFGRVGFAWTMAGVFTGARHVIMNFNPQQALGLIRSEKVTVTNLVPTMASFMLAVPDLDSYDLSSLRGVVFAGAPLPPSILAGTQARICPNVYEYYGLQETGILVAMGPAGKAKAPHSVGQLIPFAEVRIIDAFGKDVPRGEVGEIVGRHPATTGAYYKNEEKTKETFRDGWFYTGDLGRFDADGYLYISGRTKDMIISGGQNVFSVEVENLILGHPAVADCAVIGLPDDTWGERVTAVCVKAAGAEASEEDMIAFCKGKIAGFKVPKQVIWLEGALPRTPTGKVTKYLLVQQYAKR